MLPEAIDVGTPGVGPVIAVLGGVHGDELEGVLAARIVIDRLRALDPGRMHGTVRVVAPAHPAAWAAGTRASPIDGLNLARVFPGSAEGSPTEQVAAHLTTRVIAGADLLIDLHSGGQSFDMPLMVGYHAGPHPVCLRSADVAAAFGAPFRWEHPEPGAGRSLSAAAALGVPSVYVEGQGGGQVRRRDLDGYVDGVLRVLHLLGVLNDGPVPGPEPVVVRGDGNTDGGIEAGAAGFFVTSTGVGEQVTTGQVLGEIVDQRGRVLAKVDSPRDGIVMLTRRRAAVSTGDTVAIVAERVGGPR
ncbi:succinylglutamate desuccinylase/aspartoacylase family protein [Georgenia sp. MJ173]|uniref:succinylglutamate desuccinylase/aspartoacylase family protein n=1 Tax=Georgenia sunbinii TaxID=3117728 RepID=UPI002F26D9AC